MKDRYIFAAIFDYADDGISVRFPDLPGAFSCGETDEEAFRMAKECLAVHLYGMEQDGEVIPEPTRTLDLRLHANESAVLVDVWMPPFRDYMAQKAVKKTLTITKWLNDAAEEANVNFSRILQDGLKSYLGVSDRKSYEKGPVE